MRSALTIVAVVAGYSLLETILLFSVILHTSYAFGYPGFVAWSQIPLIPGVGALISWAMNGSHRWLFRTLRILLGGLLAIPTVLVSVFVIAAAIWPLAWFYDLSRALFALLLSIELCALLLGLLFLVRKSGVWGARAEAERWLAERQEVDPRDRYWRNRAARIAVCIPSLIVLPIFLFLPETLGLISEFNVPHVADLAGWRVKIPWTWSVQYQRVFASDGRSWVVGVAGKGIGRGVSPLRWDSMTGWTFGTKAYEGSNEYVYGLPGKRIVLDRRAFKIGNEEITCTDFRPFYDNWPNANRYALIAHIDCSGPGRFYASMDGGRDQVALFYDILNNITPAPIRVLPE